MSNFELKPFVKWAGGKEKELPIILENLPKKIDCYFEPFVGGGAVFFSIGSKVSGTRFINDKSDELVGLYNNIAEQNPDFFSYLREIEHNWTLLHNVIENHGDELYSIYIDYKNNVINKNGLNDRINAFILRNRLEFNGMLDVEFNVYIERYFTGIVSSCVRKFSRTKELELKCGDFGKANVLENIETALKSSFYTHMRYIYNKKNTEEVKATLNEHKLSAIFYFLREFCYAAMFRYNANGDFNVPYGGMAYNNKDFLSKINRINTKEYGEYLSETNIVCDDFEHFMKPLEFGENDFIFLDPPYDTEFSDYANNEFSKNDQVRLANFCKTCKAKIMIVIKETDFIRKLYEDIGFKIETFEKTYLVNFQNRNDRKTNHLLITNY